MHLLLILLLTYFGLIKGHGRLMEPPSRASMWRVGYKTPMDENDNQGYCGGFGVQFNRNNGKCGICGDPWDVFPRPHEAPGGIYANGIITKTYTQGSLIPVIIDVSANHLGSFVFKICPNNNLHKDSPQSCFDAHPLKTGPGAYEYKVQEGLYGLTLLYVRLPRRLSCSQCILQWTYVGGNNWGICSNGTSGLGCGNQEHFRSCADIRILPRKLAIVLNEYLEEKKELVNKEEAYRDEDYFRDEEEDGDLLTALNSVSDEHKNLRKQLLEELLEKVKELISLSQSKEIEDTTIIPDWEEEQIIMTNRHG